MFTWIAAKLGSKLLEYVIGSVLVVLIAGGGYYTVKYAWYSWFERPGLEKKITQAEAERDKAINNWVNEKQRSEDLDKTITFQRSQLARRQKVQKEASDVDKAVAGSDISFFRHNADRLYDYKNPASAPPVPPASGKRGRAKPAAQTGKVH